MSEKNRLGKFITFILLMNIFSSCAFSNSNDCSEVLFKSPLFINYMEYSKEALNQDLDVFIKCGEFDSLDVKLFQQYFIMKLLVLHSEGTDVTYNYSINYFKDYKLTEDYKVVREILIISHELENKKIDLNDWEYIKKLFLKIGLKEGEIEAFRKFIIANELKDITYEEAYVLFTE